MGNPFARFGMSDSEFDKALRSSVEVDAGIDKFMAEEVIPYGRSVSPVETGNFAASWKIMKKAKNGRGVVGPTAWYSHFIEFGTGADKKQSRGKKGKRDKKGRRAVEVADGEFRLLGPNTPTKPLAPVQRTAEHFGGSLKGGVSTQGGDE
ncbi:HK97 gp10 family phage protein [Mycobacteroides chelonae]|uniref:HK97 gp10 family phage protein n=1 Tax=Mycobacteroides chelonae TaxID=1774 RepID=UPI0009935929|nr:HK97 gp10 family phage protein [Mycobacteroides chelonae]